MNKETLQKQVEEMKLKLAEMEAELNKKEDVFPKIGDKYWLIYAGGGIVHSTFVNDASDNDRLTYGNFYKTKEEAEKARDIQLAKVRLTNRIKELNDGWYPDWNDIRQAKYHFEIKVGKEASINYWPYSKLTSNNMYMKSKDISEQILSEMEEDIRLVLGE